jgi:telomerase reverse transcriptase
MAWLRPDAVGPHGRLSRTDFQKRREVLLEFVYYLFDSILIPLIRANFHVTESNSHRNRLFFFRHDVWRVLTEPSLNAIRMSMFEPLSMDRARRMLESRSLGFSQMRLLPKSTSFRPIMNLRKRVPASVNGRVALGQSVNDVLKPVFTMLSYERANQPSRLGSALFSVGDLYPRIKAFRDHLLATGRLADGLFFVKTDVQSCFDTIPQHRVIRLVERLCSENEYRSARHTEIRLGECHGYRADGGAPPLPVRKFVTKGRAGHDFDTFEERASRDLASGRKETVFVDSVMETSLEKERLLDLLGEHVQRNIVKIGKKFFRQKEGIPQGSVLSSLLCNFFYAEFERECLGFLATESSLLVRLIDDFLLVSTERSQAERFVEVMHGGNERYGIRVRPEKTLVNFGCGGNVSELRGTGPARGFPYCGVMIDTRTLKITKDRSRLSEGGKGEGFQSLLESEF